VTTTTEAEPQASPPAARGDRIFQGLATGAGIMILVALAAVFIFLAVEGIPGIDKPAANYRPLDSFWPYVGRLLFGTIFAALIALVIAVPFALGIALFISHYAPRALAVPVAYVIDLLAAVPSVVFGLWGARVLGPYLIPAHG
jgi:phosphate transport system permease protein